MDLYCRNNDVINQPWELYCQKKHCSLQALQNEKRPNTRTSSRWIRVCAFLPCNNNACTYYSGTPSECLQIFFFGSWLQDMNPISPITIYFSLQPKNACFVLLANPAQFTHAFLRFEICQMWKLPVLVFLPPEHILNLGQIHGCQIVACTIFCFDLIFSFLSFSRLLQQKVLIRLHIENIVVRTRLHYFWWR